MAPSLAFSAASTSLSLGQSTPLSWNAQNATGCSAGGAWSGTQSPQGHISVTPSAAGQFDYTLSCSGAAGNTVQTVSLKINGTGSAPTPPSITMNLANPVLAPGQTTLLSWSATAATLCQASGAWNGTEGVLGSQTINAPSPGSWTYALACTGPGGTVSRTATLAVSTSTSSTLPAVALTVYPSRIAIGQSATLSWTAPSSTTCNASGDWQGAQPASGNLLVAPAVGSYTYKLNCGSASNSASLTVVDAHNLGGTISGLSSGSLVVTDGWGDSLNIGSNGSFQFSNPLPAGSSYQVSVATPPAGENCTVNNGSGQLGESNVNNVDIVCSAASYGIGGSIAGLHATGLVLQNNASDNLTINANSSTFSFSTPVTSASNYHVTVLTQPAHQVCAISNGSGSVSDTAISTIAIYCSSQLAYVVNSGDGTVSQLLIASDGHLVPLATATTTVGNQPQRMAIDPSGQYAYVSNAGSANLSAWTIDTSGNLQAMSTATFATGNAPSGLSIDNTGKHLYVCNRGSGNISQFSIGPSGLLTPLAIATVNAGAQPYSLYLSLDGQYAYAINLQGAISQYSFDASGNLQPLPIAAVAAGSWPLALTMTAVGRYAYAAVSGTCNTCKGSIHPFAVDTQGNLTPLSTSGINADGWTSSVVAAPSAAYIYAGNYAGNNISMFKIGSDGTLTALNPATLTTGQGPIALAIDASGHYLYAVNQKDNSISQFAVASDGHLTPLTTPTISTGSLPSALIITPVH